MTTPPFDPRSGSLVERALFDEAWRAECLHGLDVAAERLGHAGACARAAEQVLDVAFDRAGPRGATA